MRMVYAVLVCLFYTTCVAIGFAFAIGKLVEALAR